MGPSITLFDCPSVASGGMLPCHRADCGQCAKPGDGSVEDVWKKQMGV